MIRIDDIELYYLSIATDQTLSFGAVHVHRVSVVRVGIRAHRVAGGAAAVGWADAPLNLAWAWPGFPEREAEETARSMIGAIRSGLVYTTVPEDPFVWFREVLTPLVDRTTSEHAAPLGETIPELLASLVAAPFDLAWHDLFGTIHGRSSWDLYRPPWVTGDLAEACPVTGSARVLLDGVYPADILNQKPKTRLPAWHLVGISDPVEEPANPRDLSHWIRRDGLRALKVKLNGADPEAAADRLIAIMGATRNTTVRLLSVDFNGTLPDREACSEFTRRVTASRAAAGAPSLVLVEQPFGSAPFPHPPAWEDPRFDGGPPPIFALDESITTAESVLTAHAAGWDAVVVKTCKTQTRAIVLAAIARRLGMRVIVQDLTNPMLALLAHLQLAAHLDDGWGVEVNGVQYYPEASQPEAMVHPAAFARRNGYVSTESLGGPGIGYRIEDIERRLPERAA